MANIAWALSWETGDDCSVYYYNGSAWSYVQDVNCGAVGGHLHASIWGITESDVWFAISKLNVTKFYHYLNGAWTTQSVAVRIQRMWGNATNNIWAIGFTGTPGVNAVIEWWHYDGTSWTQFQVDVNPNYFQYHIFGKDATTIWSMKETAGTGVVPRTRYDDGTHLWAVDDGELLDDGNRTWFGVYGLYHPGGTDLFYMLTRTNAKLLALYTRDGIGAGTWALHSQIPTVVAQTAGAIAYNNCIFKRGDKIWAVHPDEAGPPGECWYYNGAVWANVTPPDVNHIFHVHGNSDIVFMGGNDATVTKFYVWRWNTATETWDAPEDLSTLGGKGNGIDDIWVAEPTNDHPLIQCNTPTIGSDFTINNYICLPSQHAVDSGSFKTKVYHVPYFLNSPAASLRNRSLPYSSSIG